MAKVFKVKFVCPECGGTELEQRKKVVEYATILNFAKNKQGVASVGDFGDRMTDEDLNYAETYYVCSDCGFELPGTHDDEHKVFMWLESRGMIEVQDVP